jgi:peptidyl-prolyl cis-trans isomerase A (cyclophilin A)
LGAAVMGVALSAYGQTEGIYADFTTSLGDFTVRLDYERAPRAVASFVGLATGEKAWADPQGNIWNRPFYDGSIFHRVVQNVDTNSIAVQGGGFPVVSGTATNFSNAGFYMLEAVTNGLAHSNGVISLANSGPNTDGSQFFIAATNVPFWNGSYTVFGHVMIGMGVVTSIAAVAVQAERPVEDVILHSVVIRRVGASADAFLITNQGVPVAESGPVRAYTSGTNMVLEFDLVPQSETVFRISDDLKTWQSSDWGLGIQTNAWTLTRPFARDDLGPATFLHAARIRYPIPVTSPINNRGRYFTFYWDGISGVKYEVIFSTNWLQQGQYRVTTGTNAPVLGVVFFGDRWTREPYSARMSFTDDSGQEYSYSLGFNPGQVTNRFVGNYWPVTNAALRHPISGVFTVQ